MSVLLKEIDSNFLRFASGWRKQLQIVAAELEKELPVFQESYRRLTTLQAWRATLLEPRISEGSLRFFLEAQNDGLVSHVHAALGSWRSALKSLRSAIENVCFCLYYMDHPVELEMWDQGRHVISFSGLVTYLQQHPRVSDVEKNITGIDLLQKEYTTLSKAVHASAAGFRMTADVDEVRLWTTEKASVGGWATREKEVVCGLNLLLLTIFRAELQGTKASGLRDVVSIAVPAGRHAAVHEHLKIVLTAPAK